MEKEKTGKELLEEIKLEKEKMIKEGKLKKEKPLPEIKEEEIPYKIPENWVWCRLGELLVLNNGEKIEDKEYFYLDVKTLRGAREYEVRNKGNRVSKGDYVILVDGENSGETFVIPVDGYMGSTMKKLEFINKKTINFLNKNILIYKEKLKKNKIGSAIPHLNKEIFKSLLIGLPPLSTQQKIVDYLESAMDKIKESRSLFEEVLEKIKLQRTAILHKAITGQLTEQLERDGNAKDLLEEIKLEKEKMIKEGKLKKEKPLPEIKEEEIPYEIPENWVWCRLGEIVKINLGGGTPSKKKLEYWNGEIYWASVKDMQEKYLKFTEDKISLEGLNNSSSNLIPKGNIIVCTRMGLGKICILENDIAINQDLRGLILYEKIEKEYFYNYYKTLKFEGRGTTVKGISVEELSTTCFPLPPLSEQERIVEIVERNFERLDEIEEMIKENQNKLELLEKSILEKAFRGEIIQ